MGELQKGVRRGHIIFSMSYLSSHLASLVEEAVPHPERQRKGQRVHEHAQVPRAGKGLQHWHALVIGRRATYGDEVGVKGGELRGRSEMGSEGGQGTLIRPLETFSSFLFYSLFTLLTFHERQPRRTLWSDLDPTMWWV